MMNNLGSATVINNVFSCDSSSIGSNVGQSVGGSVRNHELKQSLLSQFHWYISVIVQCNDAGQYFSYDSSPIAP